MNPKDEILELFRVTLKGFFECDWDKGHAILNPDELNQEIYDKLITKEDFIKEFLDLWKELYE